MNPASIVTLNGKVLETLRSDILSCRLKPNERLRTETLRMMYGAGTSPIREALMRLAAEGLVVLEQNKGFRVAGVSHEQLEDIMRTRAEIEILALRRAIEIGGVDWEASVLGAFHRLSRQPKSDSERPEQINEAWKREHKAFHDALVAACQSPSLLSIRAGLFDQCDRYVALSVTAKTLPRDDVAEHEEIMKATIDRDAEKAERLLRKHIELTTEKVKLSNWFSDVPFEGEELPL
ncbi:MAG: FCD domain-containing protein [Rhodobiaceae bacterium]|nr:FCD domain-containing protein [Rhodobiaceae bacterium]MCC0048638.1 FCD domain-containing protein [Rhodobiaceae bacterium]